MTCNVDKQCDNYKEYNFCPIKHGDTFPETSIRVFKRDEDDVETPIDILAAEMRLYKYGKEDVVLVTTLPESGVVVIKSFNTDILSKTTYTYKLKLTLATGRVVSWISGTLPIE